MNTLCLLHDRSAVHTHCTQTLTHKSTCVDSTLAHYSITMAAIMHTLRLVCSVLCEHAFCVDTCPCLCARTVCMETQCTHVCCVLCVCVCVCVHVHAVVSTVAGKCNFPALTRANNNCPATAPFTCS